MIFLFFVCVSVCNWVLNAHHVCNVFFNTLDQSVDAIFIGKQVTVCRLELARLA